MIGSGDTVSCGAETVVGENTFYSLPPGSAWGRDVRGGCIDLGFGGKFGTRRGRWLELLCLRMCGSISCAATGCGWSDHSFVWLSAEAGTLLSEQNKSRLMCVV